MADNNNKILNLDFSVIPGAVEFITSKAKFLNLVGGVGSGKSYCMLVKGLLYVLDYPRSRIYFVRASFRQLNDSVRKDFFKLLGVKPSQARNHPLIDSFNSQENTLYFKNGSEVSFRYAEGNKGIETLQSANLSAILIDQAESVSQGFIDEAGARIRNTDGGGQNFIALISNPRGKNHIYKTFFVDHKDDPNYESYIMKTASNPFLPPTYVADLIKSHSQQWVNRFVYASFESYEGQVYEDFDPKVHVIRKFEPPKYWRKWYGQDYGWRDPTVVLCLCQDSHGNILVYDEIYVNNTLPEEFAKLMREKGINGSSTIYGDPSGKARNAQTGMSLYDMYFEEGFNIIPANNKIAEGIGVVQKFMKLREHPHPYNPDVKQSAHLYIMDNCVNLLREMPAYSYPNLPEDREGRQNAIEIPVDFNNHALDSLRYAVNSDSAIMATNDEPIKDPNDTLLKLEEWNTHKDTTDWRDV